MKEKLIKWFVQRCKPETIVSMLFWKLTQYHNVREVNYQDNPGDCNPCVGYTRIMKFFETVSVKDETPQKL